MPLFDCLTKKQSLYKIKYNLCIQKTKGGKTMNQLELEAYAKINLGLDVVRRLENGYHEVRMIMQTVGICDTVLLEKAEAGIRMFSDSEDAPADEANLAYKAAKLFLESTGEQGGVCIHLKKRIPVAAGMAGGSTDAAAVLKGMNVLFDTCLSEKALREIGVKLGADVPYCIMGGTALAEGIGEKLTKLPDAPATCLLIAKPDISVSTKYVYENLNLSQIENHPDISGMTEAVKQGALSGIIDRMENVLESVTEKKYPIIAQLKHFMEENGAVKAMMSGSGPTVFGIFKEEKAAGLAKDKLEKMGLAKQIFVTTFR